MKRSKYTDEQILAIVKEGEAGRKVADLCRANGITEQTYYRWKAKYGGMELRQLSAAMPWVFFRTLSDPDLRDIFAYLKTLRPPNPGPCCPGDPSEL